MSPAGAREFDNGPEACARRPRSVPWDMVCTTMLALLRRHRESSRMGWQRVERPGPFGAARDQRYAEFDERFGKGNWRIAWAAGSETLSWEQMASMYEDAYFKFLSEAPGLLARLSASVLDVYEDSVSNTASGLDYSRQESVRNHITDIVIRRCLLRLGRAFRGTRLLQLAASNTDPLCVALSPGVVPFHQPGLIVQPELRGWWRAHSVESFYQSNKFLEALASAV